jgi:hypothetical protein
MTFDVSSKAQEQLSGRLEEGSVELPFSTAIFWVVNGKPELSPIGGVPYLGGWAAAQQELEDHLKNESIELPKSLTLTEFQGEEQKYFAYTTRSLAIAPVAMRKRNIGEDGRYREHLQVLGYAMIHDGKQIQELGATILTVKGWQSANLKDAFKRWERASLEARRTFANSLDVKFFYLPVGTFGKDPVFTSVGKGKTSKITPIEGQIPATVDEAVLKARFVGSAVSEVMAEMKRQSMDWQADWKEDKVVQQLPEDAPNFGEQELNTTDDIPF